MLIFLNLHKLNKSNSKFRFLEVEVKLKNSFVEYAFESWFLCEVPLPSLNFEANVLIRWSCFELDDAEIWTFSSLQVILWSFLFVKQFWVRNVEFIPLNSFGWRVIIIVVLTVVFVPLDCNSSSVDVLRFLISKAALCFTGHPVIKLFLILFQTFIFLKLDNLLGYEVNCHSWIVNDCSTQQIVIFRQRQVLLQLFSAFLKFFFEYLLCNHLSFSNLLFFSCDESMIDQGNRSKFRWNWFVILFTFFVASFVLFVWIVLSKISVVFFKLTFR